MWNQVGSQSISGTPRRSAGKWKKATLRILPCTVSQLLSAPEISNDTFAICDRELIQVSVVGVIRGISPFKTNVQYSVDDMTGPLLNVKQWVNKEDCAAMTDASPGTYVKVTGSLRNFRVQRYLMAMNIHCILDMNEITSHMLEVVQAHMQLTGKVYDVNMNTSLPSLSGRYSSGHPKALSTIQDQVFNAIRKSSDQDEGISLNDLNTQLHFLKMTDISTGDFHGTNTPGTTQAPAGSIKLHHVLLGSMFCRKKPTQTQRNAAPGELKAREDEELKGLLGLPEEETELDVHGLNLLFAKVGSQQGVKKILDSKGNPSFLCNNSECEQPQTPEAFATKNCRSVDLTELKIDSCRH